MDNPVLGMIMQIGSETIAGDGGGVTGANKRLRNTRLQLAPQWEDTNEYKGEGQLDVNNVQPGYEHVEGDSTCPLSFTEACYVLESAAKKLPDPSVGTGGSYVRVYREGVPGVDTMRTYVIQRGNGRMNFQYNYCFWNNFTLAMNNRVATIGGGVVGQQVGIIDAMTATPTKVPNVLAWPKDIGLFFAYSRAALGTAPIRIGRAFDFTLTRGDKYNIITTMNEDLDTYVTVVEKEEGVETSLTVRLGAQTATPTQVLARANSTAYPPGSIVKKAGAGPHPVLFKSIATTGTGLTGVAEPAAFATAVPGQVIVDTDVTWKAIRYDFRDPISQEAARQGETFYLMSRAIGPVIDATAGIYYLIECTVPVQANNPYSPESENGLSVNAFDLRVVEDEVSGYSWETKIVNKLAQV